MSEDKKETRGRPEKGRQRYNITLPPELHARAKAKAKEREETLSDLIEFALKRVLR